MQISEKRMIPLNMENITSYNPKKEKEILESRNIEIDVHVNEEDEELLKIRDMPRRKSSTGSTSSSKPEDPSELFSYPSSPKSLNSQEFNKSGIFFSKDRNCSKNNIFNFYQITEEHIRETFPEYNDYIKSKNYITKQEFFLNNEIHKEYEIKEQQTLNNTHENKPQNILNNNVNNINKITAIPTIIGTFTPNSFNGNRGKFDLPMQYYIGFYPVDAFKYNQEKNAKEEKAENNKSLNEKEKKVEPDIKQQQPMMIGTPIFIQNIPKFWNNKMFKKKNKTFTEREGDWVCQSCKNLNFAFRVECNRCHLPKPSDDKKDGNNNKENKSNKDTQEQKGHKRSYKYKKNYNHHNKNKGNEYSKE